MKIIVFDTETSGIPCGVKQTTIVQFSYIIYDCELNQIIKEVDSIIKQPLGFIIPKSSINIHKITDKMCATHGVDLMNTLNEFIEDTKECYRIVGHNVNFDIRMILISLKDLQNVDNYKNVDRKINYIENNILSKLYCTMIRGTKWCKIPKISKSGESMKSYKYPKLSELHMKLFGECPDGLHNALVDVNACLRCYIVMNTYMNV
jgi:DNA polymerase III epsilon subunit-like protein